MKKNKIIKNLLVASLVLNVLIVTVSIYKYQRITNGDMTTRELSKIVYNLSKPTTNE